MSIEYFPVVIPAEIIGETYLLFQDGEVTAIPAGMEQGLTVGKVLGNGRYMPNTKHKFSKQVLNGSARLFKKAFEGLNDLQLVALGLIPADVPEILKAVQQHRAFAKAESEKRRIEAAQRKAEITVLSVEEQQERDRKRAETEKKRAEAAKAEADELRRQIEALTAVEPEYDDVFPGLSRVDQLLREIHASKITSPKTLAKRYSLDQLKDIAAWKPELSTSIDPSAMTAVEIAEAILNLKATQNGSFVHI